MLNALSLLSKRIIARREGGKEMGAAQLTKRRLFRAVVLGLGILVIPAMIIFQWFFHVHPVYKEGLLLIQASPSTQGLLGQPIEPAFWVHGRSGRKAAEIEFGVNGPKGEARASIEAMSEGPGWRIRHILLKLPGHRWQPLPEAEGHAFK